MIDSHLIEKIQNLPLGYSRVRYLEKYYGVTRTDYNQGKSIKVYAEALSGNDFISFNFYNTSKENLLKPCEMPKQEVVNFLNNYKLIKQET